MHVFVILMWTGQISCQEWPKIILYFLLCVTNTVSRSPLSISRGMEQLRGAARATENPGHQDSISPQEREERGESLLHSGALMSKSSRLELNGSPAAPGNRQNGTPLRPLGGGGIVIKQMWVLKRYLSFNIKQVETPDWSEQQLSVVTLSINTLVWMDF